MHAPTTRDGHPHCASTKTPAKSAVPYKNTTRTHETIRQMLRTIRSTPDIQPDRLIGPPAALFGCYKCVI